MKKSILTIIFGILVSTSIAQLKVDPNGRVGIGTLWPNPGYKCHVSGDLLLSNYPSTPTYELQLKVQGGSVQIGTGSDQIFFYSPYVNYHKLYAEEYYKVSDSSLKINVLPIESALIKLKQLGTYSYDIENNQISELGDKKPGYRKEYGFISQEVEKVLDDVQITSDANGIKLMDYDQIIPLAVAAIKEQQLIIDSLKDELKYIISEIENIKNNVLSVNKDNLNNKTILFQNKPNPFNGNSIIGYEINLPFKKASIMIFDLNGSLIKSYPIYEGGEGQVRINSIDFKSGMYIYSLLLDDNEIDSKRMIIGN